MGYEASVGLYCFLGMLTLIIVGVPIFISILLPALAGFWLVGGANIALTQFTDAPYNITSDYVFATVPMFILMGELAAESGIASSAYYAASKWLSRIRGGLLMATVGASALFGACTGTTLASCAVFTKVSLPELDEYKYDKRISMGCIAASGSLSTLIPPSVSIIIFCILTRISIGKALVAGIIPGILVAIVTMLTIMVIAKINPKSIPLVTDIKVTWRERFSSLTSIWPIMFLFILVIGGMYAGIFPPTIGGAIGAAGVLVYALAYRVSKRKIFNSFWETVLINTQIFPILMSGFIFSRFIALSGLPGVLVEMLNNAQFPPLGVMGIVVILYLFLGCVLEIFSIMIITIPIVFPVMTALGFDPLTLCITLVFLSNVAGTTPPVGMQVFAVASVAKVDSMEVFRGIIPFFIGQLIVMWIIILFPTLNTWLPGLFF